MTETNDPIAKWVKILRENKVSGETRKDLIGLAENWLTRLRKNGDITPKKARDEVMNSVANSNLQELFRSYFTILFFLTKESSLVVEVIPPSSPKQDE